LTIIVPPVFLPAVDSAGLRSIIWTRRCRTLSMFSNLCARLASTSVVLPSWTRIKYIEELQRSDLSKRCRLWGMCPSTGRGWV